MRAIDYFNAIENRASIQDIDCQAVREEENENLAEQAHKKDCDINEIVRRIEKTNQSDAFIPRSQGIYGDFTQFTDFQQNLNLVIEAQDIFDSLRADIRKKFDNDPAKLMQFLDDNKNYDEAVALGLCVPKQPKQSQQEPEPKQKSKEKPKTTEE